MDNDARGARARRRRTGRRPRGEELLDRLISDEMGEKIAQIMRSARRAQEAWHRSRNPDEGLRERKRRLTRQLISDAATTMFATRGFDNVKVSEVADRVGVSEKTIYNYFPTKESLVLDTADEAVERMARALRERGPDESLTDAVVRAIKEDMARFDQAPDELVEFIPLFLGMIDSTPALRAAWLEMHDRLANVARDELAAQAGVDPRDPEPMAAGRALAGLAEVAMESRIRRIREGLRGDGAATRRRRRPGARGPAARDRPVVIQPAPQPAGQAAGAGGRPRRGGRPRPGAQGAAPGARGVGRGAPRGRHRDASPEPGAQRSSAGRASAGGQRPATLARHAPRAATGLTRSRCSGPAGSAGSWRRAGAAGADVTVVARPRRPWVRRAARVPAARWVRTSARGPRVATTEVGDPVDVLFVATKATGLGDRAGAGSPATPRPGRAAAQRARAPGRAAGAVRARAGGGGGRSGSSPTGPSAGVIVQTSPGVRVDMAARRPELAAALADRRRRCCARRGSRPGSATARPR